MAVHGLVNMQIQISGVQISKIPLYYYYYYYYDYCCCCYYYYYYYYYYKMV